MSNAPISLDERRRRRSTNPLTAMSYQLDQAIEDFDLDASLIATTDGLLFAHSNRVDRTTLHSYAAYTSELFEPLMEDGEMGSTIKLSDDVYMHVEAIELYGQTMLICSIGRHEVLTHLSTFRVLTGIERITQEHNEAVAA